MKRWAGAGLLLATLVGLALTAWTLRATGLAAVVVAATRIGWGGFVAYCLYSLVVFGILGVAWLVSAAGETVARLPAFAWARLVREAVSDLLPLSQVGGLVIGARVLIGARVPPVRVYASMVVDMTTEMASQLVFTVLGLSMMAAILVSAGGDDMRWPVIGGTAIMAGTMAAFFFGQRWALPLARRLSARLLPAVSALVEAVEAELARTYAHRRRVMLAMLVNLAGWIGSALGAWLALRLMGQPVGVATAISIESLIFTVRSVAFAVPAAIGVQEAAYALVMPLFGLPAEVGLALSLVKRARELAIGLPALLAWQIREAHALTRPAA